MFDSDIRHVWLVTLLGTVAVVVVGIFAVLAPPAVGQVAVIAGAALFVLGVPACVVFVIWAGSESRATKEGERNAAPALAGPITHGESPSELRKEWEDKSSPDEGEDRLQQAS